MSAKTVGPTATVVTRQWLVTPSLPVAIGVFVAYVAAFTGLSATSGIAYGDWFVSGHNALRAAVIPLIGGSLVLVAFLLWARWDWVFKDPDRLPFYGLLWVPVALFTAAVVAHAAIRDWGSYSTDLLLALLAAGVLVGFAEETLFRGIILRSMRTSLRPEAWVVVISSLWFGLYHLTNLANGAAPGSVIFQCVFTAGMGVVFYLFRRVRGLLVLAMAAHGLWDLSAFVPGPAGTMSGLAAILDWATVALGVVAAVVIAVRERKLAVDGSGLNNM